ncbi:MAG TPA: GtrA family protein [Solirubrobacteraceae bacterium]|jgi:putative flippase GtrA|nr:GtrA family protein [Solirubrobacteraceae bacterium]
MPDEATAVDLHARKIRAPVELRPHMRLVHGLRRPANWLQLVRFGVVGAVGFVVNLAVYALFVHPLAVDYHVAAVAAWLVAVLNNFVLNRHWTFDARGGQAHAQAMRFIVVSLVAFGVSLLLLTLLVETAGLAKVPAQALAVAASMPFNFIGNKLWSFRSEAEDRAEPTR